MYKIGSWITGYHQEGVVGRTSGLFGGNQLSKAVVDAAGERLCLQLIVVECLPFQLAPGLVDQRCGWYCKGDKKKQQGRNNGKGDKEKNQPVLKPPALETFILLIIEFDEVPASLIDLLGCIQDLIIRESLIDSISKSLASCLRCNGKTSLPDLLYVDCVMLYNIVSCKEKLNQSEY